MAKKPTRKADKETAAHDQWRYKGDEAKLFLEGDEIPAGWKDTPA